MISLHDIVAQRARDLQAKKRAKIVEDGQDKKVFMLLLLNPSADLKTLP